MTSVGTSLPRLDGPAKTTGRARYVDDLVFPDMLHARTIRSEVAHGTITRIEHDLERRGFVVCSARDVPGENVVQLIEDDQPCLADRVVRHREEPILVVAHPEKDALLEAAATIEIDPLPACFDPEASGTVFKALRLRKGTPADGFAAADLVVEGTYRTGSQEQLYLEPQGVVAVPERGGITIHGSLQCPYYVHAALVRLLGLPSRKVRVVQTETGGGFGGKEEYPSMIAGHAALLARKAGRPVKLIYDREEDMRATTKRHPSIVRHRTGVTRDGRLVAIEVDVLLDAGAYVTLSPVVLSRGVLHATGAYRCDHVEVRGRAVLTNTPPNGAFRGFGAPQTLFAAEVHMDRIAAELGLDPVTIRERNLLRRGDTTATGQKMKADCSARKVLKEAVRRTDFRRRRKRLAGTDRGLGLSLFFHGSGFTGAGEERLASRATLETTARGVRILVSSTEIGQGTRTMLAQIVADALERPVAEVEVSPADTALVPDSGPTVASRTCMVVGRILLRAATAMRKKLAGAPPAEWHAAHGPLRVTRSYRPPPGHAWDDERYVGDAYAAYAWAANVAEVELDPLTFEVRPIRLTAVVDVGKAIHPTLVRGQIEGGAAQGVSWALLEDVVVEDGVMKNAQLTNYVLPTTLDTPELDVVLVESPFRHGPFGAKGVGECPIDGPAPAVANALRHLGLDVRSIPATPERLMETPCVSS
ncbi:MAG: xanthine dehydrogenase family protein molybdopterin-binding subunit [Planctomycetota bacterium JB042]